MHVTVDAARKHQSAARVDHRIGCTQIIAERYNLAVANAHIACDRVAGRDDPAATHDGIQRSHQLPLYVE